jgi:hypothetical protein
MGFIKALLLSTLTCGVILFSSCSKDKVEATVQGTITANVNGTPTKFNTNAVATSATVSGNQLTSINGKAADGTSIAILLGGSVTAGKTYSSNAPNDNDKPVIEYSTASDDYVNDDSSVSNVSTVSISTISSNAVSGTFSGKLTTIVIGNSAIKTAVITDGKFSLSLVK